MRESKGESAEPQQLSLFPEEEEKTGELIDLGYELRVRQLARELAWDLGLTDEQLESWGGGLAFANRMLDFFDTELTEFDQIALEEDHRELFELLRARTGR